MACPSAALLLAQALELRAALSGAAAALGSLPAAWSHHQRPRGSERASALHASGALAHTRAQQQQQQQWATAGQAGGLRVLSPCRCANIRRGECKKISSKI